MDDSESPYLQPDVSDDTDTLTPEEKSTQENELREAFHLFDQDGDGIISKHELRFVMRSLGLNCSDEKMVQMLREIDSNNNGTIDFAGFCHIMTIGVQEPETEEHLVEAFQVFDEELREYVTVDEIRHFMTEYGDVLSRDEADQMIKDAQIIDSCTETINGVKRIKYRDYVRFLFDDMDGDRMREQMEETSKSKDSSRIKTVSPVPKRERRRSVLSV